MNWHVCITIDSMEKYEIQEKRHDIALRGLVHCMGRFKKTQTRLHPIFALSGEYENYVIDRSDSPNKDFERHLPLNWTANELVELAAARLNTCLKIHFDKLTVDEQFRAKRYLMAPGININIKSAQEFLYKVLPPQIEEPSGQNSEILASILRRTQLTARQVITIFNELLVEGDFDGSRFLKQVSSGLQQRTINEAEFWDCINRSCRDNARDVIASYNGLFPNMSEFCSTLLPLIPKMLKYSSLIDKIDKFKRKK